jgi:hypothetical protein
LLCDRADRHSTAKCHGRSVSAVRPDCQEAALLIRCAEAKSRSSGELASVIGRDKGRVTRHLDKLEARGLIERFTSSTWPQTGASLRRSFSGSAVTIPWKIS